MKETGFRAWLRIHRKLRKASPEQQEVWRLQDMMCTGAHWVPQNGDVEWRPRQRYPDIPTQEEAEETLARIRHNSWGY